MPEPSFGLLASVLAFLLRKHAKKLTADEVLACLENQDTIRDYLEWLRKNDQAQVLAGIESIKGELMQQLPAVAAELSKLAEQVRFNAGDLAARIDELDAKIFPPVLYSTPLETRTSAPVKLRGRDQEMAHLLGQSGDVVVVGQPGSGKTFLLQEFARTASAQFLLTDDAEKAISAITVRCPPIVIVDDAWQRRDIIKRLQHIRLLNRLPFRVVAVCWPFEKDEIQQALQLSSEKIVELERLPRTTIVEIIQEVAALRKLTANDEFLRVAAKQARGLPGLAVSLTTTAIDSSPKDLVSGNILLKQLGVFMQQHVGRDASVLLAAFACGGASGIGVTQVAKALGKDVGATKAAADRIALAGTLEQTGKGTLAVQPAFLRSALITHEFFPTEGGGLGWDLCEQLILSASDPNSGYLELFAARASAGAQLDDTILQHAAVKQDDSRIWEHLAWLNPDNCSWVLSKLGDLTAELKRAALYHLPEDVLPQLLSAASRENRPLNSTPHADMRLIEDWIQQGLGEDAFKRRQILFNAVEVWSHKGGDAATALAAFEKVFDLEYEITDTDPAQTNTLRIHRGLIGIDILGKVFELWPRLVALVRTLRDIPWEDLVRIVETWRCKSAPFGRPLDAAYSTALDGYVSQMVKDLAPIAKSNNAAMRWVCLIAKRRDIPLDGYTADPDFMLLFPEDTLEDDYAALEARQAAATAELVHRWRERPLLEVVSQFAIWIKEAQQFARLWSPMPWVFCNKIAEQRELNGKELEFVLDKLSPDYAAAFISKSLEKGTLDEKILHRCTRLNQCVGTIIESTLTGKSPRLLEQLGPLLPKFSNLVRVLCSHRQIPEETLKLLLVHDNKDVRYAAAMGLFRANKPPAIAEPLRASWRAAIVAGIPAVLLDGDADRDLFDLHKLIAFEPSAAGEILEVFLTSSTKFHTSGLSRQFAELVPPLKTDERKTLLKKCRNIAHSDLPAFLVGSDLDLYRKLLADKELEQFHLDFLAGDPTNPQWIARAKLAMQFGYSPADIAASVQGRGYSWSGNLSDYFQQWVDRFEALRKSGDSDLQRIAVEGLKWAIPERDAQLRREKKQAIDG